MSSERTEKATPKRRSEARRKGQAPRSQEVGSLFVLAAGFAVVSIAAPAMLDKLEQSTRAAFQSLATPELGPGELSALFGSTASLLVALCLPVFAAVALAGTAASVLQVRPQLVTSALKPDLKRLNPIAGVKKLVSPHSLVELVKNLVKLTAIGGIAALTLWPRRADLVGLGQLEPLEAVRFVGSLVTSLAWRIIGVLVAVALADSIWSRHSFEKSLKMSKEEVKQEARQQDIAPEMKGRIKQRQRQMARARMLSDVKHADVVVTNPTHFAVALAYRPEEGTPRVLAKGADLLARRIRELAAEHDVMVVENPPLARHLYAEVEVGQQIPAAAFAAVAEVLAFVWRMSRRRRFAWA